MARTTTKPAAQQQQQPAPQPQQQVATIAPPRLPFHPAVEQRFGVDRAGWKVLCESIFPSAKTPDAIILALSYCKARRLDPFKRNIHIVPIYDSKKREEVETVWPGIAELRTTAMRTKGYAGMGLPEFGPTVTRKFKDSQKDGNNYVDTEVEVSFPEWCRITVNRIVQGNVVSFPGPTVFWLEFYNKKSRYVDAPNEQWRRRPSQMLEKCAEAGALRRAFPEEFGEEYTVEEIGAFGSLATSARQVDAEIVSTTPVAEPKRSDFTEAQVQAPDDGEQADAHGQEDPPHDRETGEVKQAEAERKEAPAGAKADDPPTDPWFAIGTGQEGITASIVALIDSAKTIADLDAIQKANGARLAKFTEANRRKVALADKDIRDSLGGGT